MLSCSKWDLIPNQESNLGPLHREYRVLATVSPGKSLHFFFNSFYLFTENSCLSICFNNVCSCFVKHGIIASLKALSLEKAMAPHSSTLAWKIPWMEEPGGLQSMRSLRVGHDWATSLSLFTFMRWRRKWQPTPVLLPGESQGRESLVGCRLWGRTVGDDWSDLAAAAIQ